MQAQFLPVVYRLCCVQAQFLPSTFFCLWTRKLFIILESLPSCGSPLPLIIHQLTWWCWTVLMRQWHLCCSYCRCEFKLPVILDKNSKTKLSQGDEDDLLVIHAYSKVGLCVCVYDYQVFLLIFLWFWRSQKSTGMGKRMRLICWLLPDLYE